MYDPRLAVFSTKPVINHGKAIVLVVHDLDGEWQFLSADEVTVEDLMIVALENVLKTDPSISEVLELQRGYRASRNQVGAEWQIVEDGD